MGSDNVNKWLSFGANLGVVIGIILLILELDQNREMMRAQTRSEIAAIDIGHLQTVSSDQGLADIVRRARFGEELDETESTRYLFHSLATIRFYENVHYQYRLGLFDEEEFAGVLNGFSELITGSAGLTSIWCQMRMVTSVEFRHEVDTILDDDAVTNCDAHN